MKKTRIQHTVIPMMLSCLLLTACQTPAENNSSPAAGNTRTESVAETTTAPQTSEAKTTTAAQTTASTEVRKRNLKSPAENDPDDYVISKGVYNYRIHCAAVPAREAADCQRIDLPLRTADGKSFDIHGFLDEETLIGCLYDVQSGELEELGTLSLKEGSAGTYQKLMTVQNSEQSLETWSEDWIILSEPLNRPSSDYLTFPLQYRLLDRKKGTLSEPFIKQSTDENGGPVAGGNFNRPLIIGDTVYYDDYSLKDGKVTVTLYGYDISDGTITETYPNCQKPMLFKDQVIAFTLDDEGEYKRLISVKDQGASFRHDCKQELMQVETNGSEIFAVTFGGDSENDLSITELQELLSGKKICTGETGYTRLNASSELVAWSRLTANYAVVPEVYDIRGDRILLLDQEFDLEDGKAEFFGHCMGKTALVYVMNGERTQSQAVLLHLK